MICMQNYRGCIFTSKNPILFDTHVQLDFSKVEDRLHKIAMFIQNGAK